jgi:hypothetical protein
MNSRQPIIVVQCVDIVKKGSLVFAVLSLLVLLVFRKSYKLYSDIINDRITTNRAHLREYSAYFYTSYKQQRKNLGLRT